MWSSRSGPAEIQAPGAIAGFDAAKLVLWRVPDVAVFAIDCCSTATAILRPHCVFVEAQLRHQVMGITSDS